MCRKWEPVHFTSCDLGVLAVGYLQIPIETPLENKISLEMACEYFRDLKIFPLL